MAAELIDVQLMTRQGLEVTFEAADAEGNKAPWTKDMFFRVKQGEGDREVTIEIAKTVDGNAVTPPTVTVTANEERDIGPFPPDYIQPDGTILLTFDAVTNTTIAAIRLGLS